MEGASFFLYFFPIRRPHRVSSHVCNVIIFLWCCFIILGFPEFACPQTVPGPEPRATWKGYASLFGLAGFPQDRNLEVEGHSYQKSEVKTGWGGGGKAGVFPPLGNGILGLEVESYFLKSSFQAQQKTGNSGKGKMFMVNTMANIILGYPQKYLYPYIGFGGGISTNYAADIHINTDSGRIKGFSSTIAGAYQIIGGFRLRFSEKWFCFSEYKFLSSHYHWEEDGHDFSLSFKSHLVLAGLGLTF